MKFGVYDHAQKGWLHICETALDAERFLLHSDVSTAVVIPYLKGDVPERVQDGEPNTPQEEVTVHPTAGATAKPPAPPTPDKPVDPDVTADVRA